MWIIWIGINRKYNILFIIYTKNKNINRILFEDLFII